MRFAGVGLVGLATLLAGAIPGSRTHACTHSSASPNIVRVDTARLSIAPEDCIRRDDTGAWTLPTQWIEPRAKPFADLNVAQVHQMLERHPELLGAASIGRPNGGSLLNGQQLPASPDWDIQVPDHAWGTPALVACLQRSVDAVQARFPGSPPLYIGDLSRQEGGWIRGHRSHQSGLDADIGYYYTGQSTWYLEANRKNLDVERTWALVRALVTDCEMEYLFIDLRIQALLREHAEQLGEDSDWLDTLFSKGRNKPGVIRHAWGHQTHIHLRIFDDRAQLTGERVNQANLWARMHRPSAWAR
jgi:murein endopeptidase